MKVVVRIRPQNAKELGNNSRSVVRVLDYNMLVFEPKEEEEPFFYHGIKQNHRDV
jgi:kinesin family protein 18/19